VRDRLSLQLSGTYSASESENKQSTMKEQVQRKVHTIPKTRLSEIELARPFHTKNYESAEINLETELE
jgi:hypothetical protein